MAGIKIEPTSSGFGVIRPDIVDELRGFASSSYIGKPMAREIDRAILLVRRAADEIERLRGEGEWERQEQWGVSYEPPHPEPGLVYPVGSEWQARAINPEGDDHHHLAWRREVRYGPWEPVEGDGDA